MAPRATYNCEQVGVFTPKSVARGVARGRRSRLHHRRHQGDPRAKVGDTVTLAGAGGHRAAGFKDVKPQVFAGLYRSNRTSTRRCATRSTS